jgi:predicted KAP-like P-loop ATPase
MLNTFAAQADSLEGDHAKSDAQVVALQTAVENFSATTASLANPSEITVVNASFESGNAQDGKLRLTDR